MKTQSPDTSPEADKLYFELLRQQTPTERLRYGRALSASAIRRERAQIARAHPNWSEEEVKIHWAAIAYGDEIAERVRAHLVRQK